MTIVNFDYIGKYADIANYKNTFIFSTECSNEKDLSIYMVSMLDKMINNRDIIQVLYTRRKKYVDSRKLFFFLVKLFICRKFTVEYIKSNILDKNNINYQPKDLELMFIRLSKNKKGLISYSNFLDEISPRL